MNLSDYFFDIKKDKNHSYLLFDDFVYYLIINKNKNLDKTFKYIYNEPVLYKIDFIMFNCDIDVLLLNMFYINEIKIPIVLHDDFNK